ncbi:MAG: polysaccharide deacetylase family protein [Peptococcaceae bacterium]|jgi:peptidoglycan/xylan/chitin deacetylase (PgdA/CDA1 family)|nr:polysaccharide deacetylase family protein [Peptococcaceae bacterium]
MKRLFGFWAKRPPVSRKPRPLTAFCVLVVCGVFLGALSSVYGVMANGLWRTVGGVVQPAPISRVVDTPGQVGLTFDVAWGDDQTEEILEVLDIYGVQATFFVTNAWMAAYPELTTKISQHGHELGLHSATHPYFSALTKEGMARELKENQKMVAQLTGQQGKFFRPPYGDYNNNVLAAAGEMGFVTIGWAVDGGDWQSISAGKICKNVLEQAKAGDIVMLQNNNPQTVAALREIFNTWQQQGLRPVPLGAMVRTQDYFVDYDGVQKGSKTPGQEDAKNLIVREN